MICPGCGKEIQLAVLDLEEYRVSMVIKHEGDFMQAKTIGGVMVNMDKMLQESAKVSGHKAYIAFDGMERKENEITIHFLIMPKAKG